VDVGPLVALGVGVGTKQAVEFHDGVGDVSLDRAIAQPNARAASCVERWSR